VHQEFQETLSRGISKRARELGYNVAFFTNFLGYDEIQYEIGERSIADLPAFSKLNGIILLPDTMCDKEFKEGIRKNIGHNASCPVVSVRQRMEDFYNVLIDDKHVLDNIIRHFIIDHGYTKINFFSGSRDSVSSEGRLESYRRILNEYGIPFDEERVFYGDYWKDMSKEAIKFWLSNPLKRPEAIICANDNMAINVCNTLEEMGISVPSDIAVSGCDNILITQDFYPNITTVEIPVFEMGVEAVEKIHKHNEHINQDKNSIITTVTKIRESCGCKHKDDKEETKKRRNRVIHELEAGQAAISNNAFMSVELTGVKTMDDLNRMLCEYIFMNKGFSDFYMCLNKNWDLFLEDNVNGNSSDHMIMELGIRKGEVLTTVEFSKPAMLPSRYMEREPQIFYFNILHYQGNCFGYSVISFYGDEVYKPSYQGWLINVCNALENIRIHNELNRLVYKLEDMYIKDDLTDLYNRRALETLGEKYLKQCVEEQSKLMVFTADMDKLKYINDNFGHACGDIAIKAVADALKAAAEDDEICMRIGGDEFLVVGLDYEQKKMNSFLSKFNSEIDRFNREAGMEFKVNVSYGWSIVKPNKFISIEDCLIVADSKMYQQKYEKETILLKHRNEFFDIEDDKKERHDTL
jgi:diguanylate cyclase (GGDEF)-like protein